MRTANRMKIGERLRGGRGGLGIASSSQLCPALTAKVRELKNRLVREWMNELQREVPARLLNSAAREAEAIAWLTPYPHLLFPALAEEKLEITRRWLVQQRAVRRRSPLLSEAAEQEYHCSV